MSKYLLCGCLLDAAPSEIPRYLGYPGVDLLEWRLDLYFRAHSLDVTLNSLAGLASSTRHPVLVTNRPTWEGGEFVGSEGLRLEVLQKAVEAGADWVDLEGRLEEGGLEWFRTSRAKMVLSHHDFAGTPDRTSLRHTMEMLAKKRPDVVKIVTYAHKPDDNLRVLDLIPFGRHELGIEVIAFCMGPLGRWSRVACLLLGSPWTYVQLDRQKTAAPGQFAASEMRTLLELIS
jgi:3-dehydroquinate dehydratase-1